MSFQIDQLEAEFERAREEVNNDVMRHLREELAKRKPTPRVMRLRQLMAGDDAPQGNAAESTAKKQESKGSSESETTGASATNESARQGGRANARNGETGRGPSGRTRLAFKPTPEQEQALGAFKTGASLKINAYAGTGKTSTLQLLAHNTPKRGQYLAFNKKIVFDSRGKFPSDVDCATTHAVAFRSLMSRYSQDQLTLRLTANELVKILELKKWRVDRDYVLAARSQAFLMLATIRRYCQSAAPQPLLEHVPRHGSLSAAPEDVVREVARMALKGAEHIWARMVATNDPIPLGHDGYLKVWALNEPLLAADYILLDEAQDTNPVVLDVLNKQSAQIVYVGDKYQQIYEWRGAVNAMEEATAEHTVFLTTSFRFGGDIARVANRVLQMLGEEKRLVGNPERDSRIGPVPNGTVLARTNASTITACIEALDAGKRPHLVGGTDDLVAMLRGVKHLKDGQPSSVPEFFGFENWQEVVEFVRSGEGEELLTFVNLVEARGENQLLWALGNVADEDDCDLVVSTAHKAKGREWSTVRLMDDFLKSLPKKDAREDRSSQIDPSELRLLYVALTRAKDMLEVPPPLMQFLDMGVLPPQAEYVSRPQRQRPTTIRPSATPPRPDWTPPRNWEKRTEDTAQRKNSTPGEKAPSASTDRNSPTAPTAPTKNGSVLFRWLTGR